MKGKGKVLDGIYPITRAEFVYIDDSKTLKDSIDDGSLGSEKVVSTSGRPQTLFSLRGGLINIRRTSVNGSNTVYYSMPNIDTDRGRNLFIWTSTGSYYQIAIQDGELKENDALLYDLSTNTIIKVNGSWGNIGLNNNRYLLLYNNLGIIGGELSKYCVYGYDNPNISIKDVYGETISSTGSTQGIFIVDENIYKCTHSNDEHTDFVNITVVSKTNPNVTIKSISHNLGHLNAPNYNSTKDMLIVGNGSKSFTLLPKGWIIPNFNSILQGSTIDFNTVDKIELDFTQFTEEWKCQLCWGYEDKDIIWMFTCDNSILRKIKLGKGSNNLGAGVYIDNKYENDYNGSYEVLGTYYSRTKDTLGGMLFYEGVIYTGIKGLYGIRKCIPNSQGWFNSEYVAVMNKGGDMQGIAIDGDLMYAFSDGSGCKIHLNKL